MDEKNRLIATKLKKKMFGPDAYIYLDKKTGVEYLLLITNGGATITVMMDADGLPLQADANRRRRQRQNLDRPYDDDRKRRRTNR